MGKIISLLVFAIPTLFFVSQCCNGFNITNLQAAIIKFVNGSILSAIIPLTLLSTEKLINIKESILKMQSEPSSVQSEDQQKLQKDSFSENKQPLQPYTNKQKRKPVSQTNKTEEEPAAGRRTSKNEKKHRTNILYIKFCTYFICSICFIMSVSLMEDAKKLAKNPLHVQHKFDKFLRGWFEKLRRVVFRSCELTMIIFYFYMTWIKKCH